MDQAENIETVPHSEIHSSKSSNSVYKFERDTFYKSCCDSRIDRRALLFFTQLSMSVLAISFSFYKLCLDNITTEEKNAWFILLSGTIAVWLPNPRMH